MRRGGAGLHRDPASGDARQLAAAHAGLDAPACPRRVRGGRRPADDADVVGWTGRELRLGKTPSLNEPRSVVGGRWSVVGGRWSVVGGRWSVVGGRWSVVGGRWSVVVGRWSLVGVLLSLVGGRWSVVGGRWSVVGG